MRGQYGLSAHPKHAGSPLSVMSCSYDRPQYEHRSSRFRLFLDFRAKEISQRLALAVIAKPTKVIMIDPTTATARIPSRAAPPPAAATMSFIFMGEGYAQGHRLGN